MARERNPNDPYYEDPAANDPRNSTYEDPAASDLRRSARLDQEMQDDPDGEQPHQWRPHRGCGRGGPWC